MRVWLVRGLAAAATVAALGYGGWLLGARAFGAALDARLAAAAAQGLAIAHGGRTVGGFPFGHAARFVDLSVAPAAGGWRLSAPAAVLSAGPGDTALLALPDGGTVEIAGASLDFAVEGLSVEPAAGAATAARLVLTPQGGAAAGRLEAGPVALRLRTGAGPDAADIEATLEAGRLALSEGDAAAPRALSEARDLSVTLTAAGMTGPTLLASLAGGGRFALAAAAGSTESRAAGPAGAAMRTRGGPARARLSAAGGRFALEAEAAATALTLAGGPFPQAAALALDSLSLSLEGPYAPAPAPEPVRVKLGLAGLTGDAAAWAALDPGGALPRDPASALLDAGAEVYWRTTLDRAAAFGAAPVGVISLSVAEGRIAGLGVEASLSGATAIEPAPAGVFDGAATGWRPLLAALERAGFVGFAAARRLEALAAAHAADPDDPDALRTRIVIDATGITANGVPLR